MQPVFKLKIIAKKFIDYTLIPKKIKMKTKLARKF